MAFERGLRAARRRLSRCRRSASGASGPAGHCAPAGIPHGGPAFHPVEDHGSPAFHNPALYHSPGPHWNGYHQVYCRRPPDASGLGRVSSELLLPSLVSRPVGRTPVGLGLGFRTGRLVWNRRARLGGYGRHRLGIWSSVSSRTECMDIGDGQWAGASAAGAWGRLLTRPATIRIITRTTRRYSGRTDGVQLCESDPRSGPAAAGNGGSRRPRCR